LPSGFDCANRVVEKINKMIDSQILMKGIFGNEFLIPKQMIFYFPDLKFTISEQCICTA